MTQNELYHYGIKRRSGRYPWGSGDRPFQSGGIVRLKDKPYKGDVREAIKRATRHNPPGRVYKRKPMDLRTDDITLNKGTKLSRLSLSKNEHVRDARKYVSIGKDTEKTWNDMFEKEYALQGYRYLYKNLYTSLKDIKVSSAHTNEQKFWDWLNMNPVEKIPNISNAVSKWQKEFGISPTGDIARDYFRQIGTLSDLNDDFFKFMKDNGYDAIADNYGMESGGNKSIILLDPGNSVELKKQKEKELQRRK